MRQSYQISVFDGITSIKMFGPFNPGSIIELMEDIAENYPADFKLYLLQSAQFDLKQEDLRKLAEAAKQIFSPHQMAAFVTNNDLIYGELRQFEVFRNPGDEIITGVFRDEIEAESWLNAKKRDRVAVSSA